MVGPSSGSSKNIFNTPGQEKGDSTSACRAVSDRVKLAAVSGRKAEEERDFSLATIKWIVVRSAPPAI